MSPTLTAEASFGDEIWTEERVAYINNNLEQIDNNIAALKRQKQAVYSKYENMA